MNIHLVRSSEYSRERYWDVVDQLRRYPGIMQFRSREEPAEFLDSRILSKPFDAKTFDRQNAGFLQRCVGKRIFPVRIETISWVSLFESCQAYRKKYDLGDDEFVILLTEYSNDNNWFAAGNPEPGRDAFVQTSHWDYFLGGDERYPVAYHVVLMILIKLLFKSYEEGFRYWHKEAVGCMMDFCEDKKQIILKLRTGDLCPACLELIGERGIDRQVIAQMFSILDGIRGQMLFKQRYAIHQKPPEMHIGGRRQAIRFPELGDLEIRLTPLEKTVYLFFLKHPEGIEMNLMHEHRHELEALYGRFSNVESLERMRMSIGELCDARSNSLSEKLSRIKNKFIAALGKEMARPFLITGENREPRKIPVSREWVIQEAMKEDSEN